MIPDDPDERGRAGEGTSGGDSAGRHPAQDRGVGGGVVGMFEASIGILRGSWGWKGCRCSKCSYRWLMASSAGCGLFNLQVEGVRLKA